MTLTSSCDVDTADIDFGTLARASVQQRTFTVSNSGAAARALSVVFTSNSSNRVSVQPSGSVSIAPGAAQTFTITLDTTLAGPATAMLALKRDQGCSSDVSISANVVDALLTYAPTTLNFGYVPPTLTRSLQVTLSNAGAAPVTISDILATDQGQSTASSIFTYAGPTSVVVPAEGTATLDIAFKPSLLGPRSGLLTFSTDASGQPTVSIPLRGIGGGPKVDVDSTLTLPATMVSSSSTARLTVRNIGGPLSTDPAGNLHFAGGAVTISDFVNTAPDEVLVELAPGYDPVIGIPFGGSFDLVVTVFARTPGNKSFKLTVNTDDVATPEAPVMVSMEVVAPAPCTYTVTPNAIDFGAPRPRQTPEWPVTITNTGTTSCALLDARIVSGPLFQLIDFTPGTLAAGASTQFHVRYTQIAPPLANGPMQNGLLRINTNSSTAPTADVPLIASQLRSCILTPASIDFGSSPASCRSATLGVLLLNTCDVPVTIGNASIVGSAEFSLVSSGGTSLPANTEGAFAARYEPANLGTDEAFLTFTTTEALGTIRHVVPLRGAGVASTVSETFPVTAPKLDVLFAIDDSPDMVSRQLSLASAVSTFGMYSSANNISVRFAATTAALTSPALGVLRRTSTNATFVSSNTPNAGTELSALLQLGGTGTTSSCLRSASLALGDERRFDANDGFLRDDAHLGVICLTDSPDETPNLVSFELDRLALVRGLQRPDVFTYSVVGPFLPTAPTGCVYDGTNNGIHDTAVGRFVGVKEEICSGNVASSAGNAIGHLLTRNNRTFTLTRQADVSSMPTVAIDGANLPTTEWSIDAATGRLTIAALYAPDQGQTVTVTYAPLCY